MALEMAARCDGCGEFGPVDPEDFLPPEDWGTERVKRESGVMGRDFYCPDCK